jgi:hypothetical protein
MYCVLIQSNTVIVYPVIYNSYQDAVEAMDKIPYSPAYSNKKINLI